MAVLLSNGNIIFLRAPITPQRQCERLEASHYWLCGERRLLIRAVHLRHGRVDLLTAIDRNQCPAVRNKVLRSEMHGSPKYFGTND